MSRSASTLTFEGIKASAKRLSGMALFVVPFGIAFGAAAVGSGLTPLQAVAMSMTVFAGASQFAILELWHPPLPLLSIALVALAVNARHLIFGAALAPVLKTLPKRHRIVSALLLSDANFADMQSARQSGSSDLGILVGGGFVLWLAWTLGTVIGTYIGRAPEDLSRFGIDVVMAAFFVTAIVGSTRRNSNHLSMAAAALVSITTLSLLPHGWNVIAGALAGGLAAVVYGR